MTSVVYGEDTVRGNETIDNDTEDPMNKYSCNECRRRRTRCSRDLPICELCSKYRRHCLYERHSRTPLTRKHLTEVEEELRLLKDVLKKHLPHLDVGDLVTKLKNGDQIDNILPSNRLPKKRKLSSFTNPMVDVSVINDKDYQIVQLLPPSIHDSISIPAPVKPISVSKTIAVSPNSQSSYNWDERKQGDLDGHPSIIDGMATTDSNSYLGAASSAALISLVGGGYFLHEKVSNSKSKSTEEGSGFTTSSQTSSSKAEITQANLETYINNYFDTYHVSYPIVHKQIFMAQFSQIIPPPPNWQSLLYIVAAIGSFMAATNPDDTDDLALFQLAKDKLSFEDLETGNLTLVQTLTLMSNYLQKRDRPNSGYNYLGLAVRMSMALGLHKNIEESNESILNKEIKRRVWWCLYIFDCGATITYGRPLGIPMAGIDAKLPINILDSNITPLSTELPIQASEPTIYSSLRLQALFHIFSNSIYERIISDPFPTTQELLNWDQEYLERWKSLIPPYFHEDAIVENCFKLAHCVIHWRYKNLRIIMYRTILLKRVLMTSDTFRDEFDSRAGEICLQECNSTIYSMYNFWLQNQSPNRRDAWYSLFFLIPAVVMPLICLRNDPNSANSDIWRSDINTSKEILQKIMKICPPAEKIINLINSLGAGFLDVQNEYTFSSVEESPSSQFLQLHHMLWPGSFDIDQQFL